MSGLATAYGLRALPVDVTVFEKSRGYGGRVATRGRYGARYDHGANYFAPGSDRVRRLVTAHLPTDGLVEIGRQIWHFDQTGALSRPESTEEKRPKWTYRQGISRLGKLLAHYSRAEVRTETRVDGLIYQESHWAVRAASGESFAPFEAVVLTPPAPQTARLLAESDVRGARVDRLCRALEAVPYTSQFSYVFLFTRPLSRPGNFFALRNSDGEHPLSWIGYEHDKPGHVPADHSMIVVQTGSEWTAERVDEEPDRFTFEIKELAEDVLVSDLRSPAWYDVQRWRYARPSAALSEDRMPVGASLGLFLAGDYVSGVGRVSEALDTGFDTAQQVQEIL